MKDQLEIGVRRITFDIRALLLMTTDGRNQYLDICLRDFKAEVLRDINNGTVMLAQYERQLIQAKEQS